MYNSFYDELEKIALSRTGSKGEGSRGGKVIGHTKSGDPIYASSEGKAKSTRKMNPNTKYGLISGLATAGILGAAAFAGRGGGATSGVASRFASRAAGRAGARAAGRAGARAGSRAATSSAGRATSSAGRATSSAGRASSAAGPKADSYSGFKARYARYEKARNAYDKAGGSEARGQGDKWREYTKAGDDFFSKDGKDVWESVKGAQQRSHETSKAYGKYKGAREAYDKAGGPFAQGKGETWREYTKRGDNFYGKDHKGWQSAKAQQQAKHEQAKAWRRKGKESQGRGSQGRTRTNGPYVSPDTRKAADNAYKIMPDLKNVTTKKQADSIWKAKMRQTHTDKTGKHDEAARVNEAYQAYKQTYYTKLAMAHWAKLAGALFR